MNKYFSTTIFDATSNARQADLMPSVPCVVGNLALATIKYRTRPASLCTQRHMQANTQCDAALQALQGEPGLTGAAIYKATAMSRKLSLRRAKAWQTPGETELHSPTSPQSCVAFGEREPFTPTSPKNGCFGRRRFRTPAASHVLDIPSPTETQSTEHQIQPPAGPKPETGLRPRVRSFAFSSDSISSSKQSKKAKDVEEQPCMENDQCSLLRSQTYSLSGTSLVGVTVSID